MGEQTTLSSPQAGATALSPLKRALLAIETLQARLDALERSRAEPIAVIGLGCRLPGGPDPDAFWHALCQGLDAISEVPADRWDVDAFYDPEPGKPGKMVTRWGGFLDRVDLFDPQFFGISPREAARMDPQQRLLLEVSWEALENAGLNPAGLSGARAGVFVGISSNDYGSVLASTGDLTLADAYTGTGNALSIAANRLSYFYDLRGPSIAVDTACSSSLVAAHMAVQSLRRGESNLALVGGVNMMLTPVLNITFSQAHMMSADGRCKTFDAAADGYVRGEGCGVVVLKRLADAQRDGDRILAVILGSAVNQDGRSNGLTAPNARAQQAVIQEALGDAGLTPGQISYIEAHGTGTILGDSIELRALGAVMADRSLAEPCVVGSVKTNIGHLEAASGIAGLIKVVLMLNHHQIPPHLHFRSANPYTPLDELPLRIPTALEPWEDGPCYAGINVFGFGGTNAHLVLGEAPGQPAPSNAADRKMYILALSARSEPALRQLAGRYAGFLTGAPETALADIAYTANTGRQHHNHRAAVAGATAGSLRHQLERIAGGEGPIRAVRAIRPVTAFLFPGQGAQYVAMGRALYETQPIFRRALDRCDEILRQHLERPFLSVLYPTGAERTEAERLIRAAAYGQPALFAVEYALAQLWASWGIHADSMLGDGVGEYVAACLADVFSLEDGLSLVAARGRLMDAPEHDDPLADMRPGAFEEIARAIAYRPPRVPVISSLTGRPLAAAPDTAYWRHHIQGIVQFDAGMQALAGLGCRLFVEAGPSPILIGMGQRSLSDAEAAWVPSLVAGADDWETLLAGLAAAYTAGAEINWAGVDAGYARRKVALPTYPFQRERHWLNMAPRWSSRNALAGDENVEQGTQAAEGQPFALDASVRPYAPASSMPALTRADLLSAPADARPGLLVEAIRGHIARVLSLDVVRIEAENRLNNLGLDSIMAIELKSAVETTLQVDLPIATLLQGPSITELAGMLLEMLAAPAAEQAPALVAAGEPEAVGPRDYPLSIGQRAMWLQHQVDPGSVYNPVHAVRIRSAVDIEKLQRTFQALVARHPALRTTFGARDGEPFQRVHPHMIAHFHVEDAAGWSDAELEQRLGDEAHRPFDLAAGPLLRVFLFTRAPSEHILLLAAHHIVTDLWSLAVLVNELGMLYNIGPDAPLPPAPVRYTDFVRWQEALLAHPAGSRMEAFWRDRLAGELPDLDLPTDRPRPAVQTFRGAVESLDLGARLARGVRQLSERLGITPYVTLLTAFQVLMHRYTGQEDVIIGSPTTGRSRAELANVIGYFVSPVAMRASFAGNPAFTELLAQTRDTVLGALANADYPFAVLVEKLRPHRDPSRTPIFQVMFTLQRAHLLHEEGLSQFALSAAGTEMRLGELSLEAVPVRQRTSPFDLTMLVADSEHDLGAAIEYNTDLYDAATVQRLLAHYRTLLEGIVADPAQTVAALPILTETERSQILGEWSRTADEPLPFQCIHHAFEAQAAQRPDATALVAELDGGQFARLTYRELNERATQLAHHLRALGVGPDTLVGLCLERSVEMIVGILGVLKAGGAYVPLDTLAPAGRLAGILEDAGARIVLTQQHLLQRANVPTRQRANVLLDADWPAIARHPTSQLPASSFQLPASSFHACYAGSPASLAYVIYTSGSTGAPKGVMLAHRGLVNLARAQVAAFDVTPQDRVLQFASYTFDASVSEIFIALTAGAALHLVRQETVWSPDNLAAALRDQRITNVTLPPTLLRLLDPVSLPDLRTVISAGEACTPDIVARWAPGRRLVNAYGPTETTIGPAYRVLNDGSPVAPSPSGASAAPIGRPIANVAAYILDRHMQPVPAGVPGELYIGGVALARGYLGRPDLTAEKFVPNPFNVPTCQPANVPTLYRTGDLARWLPDGAIEFIGRADYQVKIRGFRVELGEIEAVLARHPSVKEVAVIARDDLFPAQAAGQDLRLVAYLMPAGPTDGLDASLRAHLKETLPDYMTPAAFVMLDTLPLTTSGKVDRKALPRPTEMHAAAAEYIVPATQIERDLAAIWQEVLGVEKVSVTANFFDLGGHSLLMAQAHSKLQTLLGREVPIIELFRFPTIRSLAQHLAPGNVTEAASPGGVAVQQGLERAQQQRDALAQQRERLKAAAQRRSGK